MNPPDFTDCTLYFEGPLPAEAERLIAQAGRDFGGPGAEQALLRARGLAPEHLAVLVGLYRTYCCQHRLEDALQVAEGAMEIAGRQLGLPPDWRALNERWLASAAATSFGLLRFYLLALKAAGVVLLRLGQVSASRDRLTMIAALDRSDQLGASRLLQVVDAFRKPADPSDLTLAA